MYSKGLTLKPRGFDNFEQSTVPQHFPVKPVSANKKNAPIACFVADGSKERTRQAETGLHEKLFQREAATSEKTLRDGS